MRLTDKAMIIIVFYWEDHYNDILYYYRFDLNDS